MMLSKSLACSGVVIGLTAFCAIGAAAETTMAYRSPSRPDIVPKPTQRWPAK